jgi:TRAP-type C4-dicarboxylate transport system permease large subunit
MEEVSRWVLPFFAALVVALLLVVYIPALSLWLPNALGVR